MVHLSYHGGDFPIKMSKEVRIHGSQVGYNAFILANHGRQTRFFTQNGGLVRDVSPQNARNNSGFEIITL